MTPSTRWRLVLYLWLLLTAALAANVYRVAAALL